MKASTLIAALFLIASFSAPVRAFAFDIGGIHIDPGNPFHPVTIDNTPKPPVVINTSGNGPLITTNPPIDPSTLPTNIGGWIPLPKFDKNGIPEMPTREEMLDPARRAGNLCGDILSLGVQGHDRDNLELENYKIQEAQKNFYEHQSIAEQIVAKRLYLNSTLDIVADLDRIIDSLQSSALDVFGMALRAKQELASRSWFKTHFAPRMRSGLENEAKMTSTILLLLTNLSLSAKNLSAKDAIDGRIKKNSTDISQTVLDLKQIAHDRNLDIAGLVEEASAQLNESDAAELVKNLELAGENNSDLTAFAAGRREFYEKEGFRALLALVDLKATLTSSESLKLNYFRGTYPDFK